MSPRACLPTAALRLLPRALFLLAALLLPGIARGEDWPAYKHDAQRSSVSDESLQFPLRRAWVYQAEQAPRPAWPEPVKNLNRMDFDYAAHPVIAGGILCFASSADDSVRALDAATGKPLWRFTIDGPVRLPPQIAAGKVYFGSDDGKAYCLDAASGKLLWAFRGGPYDEMLPGNGRMISRWPVRTGVLVDNGVAYFAAGMWPAEGVFVYALDAQSGQLIWCNDTASYGPVRVVGHVTEQSLSGVTPQGAMLTDGTRLIIPMGRSAPASFDRKTGALLRFAPGLTNGVGGSWLTIDGATCYAFGKSFYSPLAISGLSLETLGLLSTRLDMVQTPDRRIPQISAFLQGSEYSIYSGKVSAIVHDAKLTARLAYGLARAGSTLLIGGDNQVSAEDTVVTVSARFRAGVSGNALAVSGHVVDQRVAQNAEKPWNGSCVEVFAAVTGKKAIGHVFLIPAAGDSAAYALLAQGDKTVATQTIRLTTTATADGYDLAALIPLADLGVEESAGSVRLELQVSGVAPSGAFNRDTVFDSNLPYTNSARFGGFSLQQPAKEGEMVLPRLTGVEKPEQLAAALADAAELTVSIKEQGVAWRAAVAGKAYELAIANGSVFVSTDQGQISCFAPVAPGAAAQADAAAAPPARAAAALPEAPKALVEALAAGGMDCGYALVLGDGDGRLSQGLAAHTRLHVINVLNDAAAVTALRQRLLEKTADYGSKIHVLLVPRLEQLPFPRYFANAVVVAGAAPGLSGAELYRVLRPLGGMLLLPGLNADAATALLAATAAPAAEVSPAGSAAGLRRGPLEGAWDWNSDKGDSLVRWPLRPIWFGGNGPAGTQNRKYQAQTLCAAQGRVFENGEDQLTAIDLYNGAQWWSRPKPHQGRSGPYTPSLSSDGESLYYRMSAKVLRGEGLACVQLDARTGKQLRVYGPYLPPPVVALRDAQSWPLLRGEEAVGKVTLACDAKELTATLQAAAPTAGKSQQWRLYLDFRGHGQRLGFYDPGVYEYLITPPTAAGEAAWAAGTGSDHPPVTVTAVSDAAGATITLKLPWAGLTLPAGKPPQSFGFAATLASTERTKVAVVIELLHVFADLFASGINNGWANICLNDAAVAEAKATPAVLAGTIEALDTKARGTWARIDQSWAAGKRIHPLTGQEVERFWIRGDGCAGFAFSASSVLNRSANVGIYDFADDSGIRTFGGVRASCGLSSLAAGGVWFIGNGGTGCECTYSFLSEVGLATSDHRLHEDWAIFADWKVDTLIRQAALNLGAPGDRRDDAGTLWLSFPRPPSHTSGSLSSGGQWTPVTGVWQQPIALALEVPMTIEHAAGMGPHRVNADRVTISGSDRPWLYASQIQGIERATLQLNMLKPLNARRASAVVAPDGKLDEATWQEPAQVDLLSTGSTVAFAFDDENLYIAGRRTEMVDRQGKPRKWQVPNSPGQAPLSFMGDYWEVFLSDGASAKVLHLAQSAGGKQMTALAQGGAGEAVVKLAWQGGISADDSGLVAEFAIPWTTVEKLGLNKDTLTVNAQVGEHPNVGEAIVRLGGRGRSRCTGFVPLGMGKTPVVPPRTYTVSLHFAELADIAAGERVFDVRLQGQPVLQKFDVVREAGGVRQALVRQFPHIQAGDALILEFIPAAGKNATATSAAILNALELMEETPTAAAGQ